MIAYKLFAVLFGLFAITLFVSGWRTGWGDEKFPGKFYVPIMAAAVLLAAGTVTAVIVGSNREKKENSNKPVQVQVKLPAGFSN